MRNPNRASNLSEESPSAPGATESGSGRSERVTGTVLRVTYRNPENDYRVVKVQPSSPMPRARLDERGELVLVGALPGIEVGQEIEAEGEWAVHPRHGPQFKSRWFRPSLPEGARGIEAYLSSDAIRGIGPVLAKRIVERFGAQTFQVMDADIDQLRKIKGISPGKLAQLKVSWKEAREDRELITFLGEHGVSPVWAHRLKKVYGGAALSVVRANPYRLAAEVRGIGFARADAIARQIGLPADAPERIRAALQHVLETLSGSGHTWSGADALIEEAARLLELDQAIVAPQLETLTREAVVTAETVRGERAVFLTALHEAERGCARELAKLLRSERRTPRIAGDAFIERFEKRARIQLADEQRRAVLRIARDGMLILTGGPGTGKTTTLRAVIEMFLAGGRQVKLAAPTGRAARRLAETSKAPAETIHRLLGFQPRTGAFAHGPEDPLDADLLVVDEASMLDAPLAWDLLKALRPGSCLMLVGDEDQLPSVGPGNVLGDILRAGVLPVVRLTEIFRQARESLIVTNAHRVNRGDFPLIDPPAPGVEPDFFFIDRENPAEVLEAIRTLVSERIPQKFRLDPIRDVQVLSPMRRGELGVETINRELQATLNPSPKTGNDSLTLEHWDEGAGRENLRVGDRVMQTTNDYDRDVSNGDVGWVQSIDSEAAEVHVRFGDRSVVYGEDEVPQLTLAYAVTIHKSQGSEYPAVVMPIHTQHYIMLQRNLLYTALTRGKRLVCIVGSKRALGRAVRNSTRADRHTALAEFLMESSAGNGDGPREPGA
jgi:exodeoxyribonuclease V alpha subunit